MTVQDLFKKTLPRLKGPMIDGMDIFQAVNSLSDELFTALLDRKSDMAKTTGEVIVEAGSPEGELPQDFRGTVEHPRVDGRGKLAPMTEEYRDKYADKTGQIPVLYELQGLSLQIYPYPAATDSDVVLKVPYWQFPEQVESLQDDIPYNGFFDQLYLDLVPAFLSGAGNDPGAMRLAVAMKVERLLRGRSGGRRRARGYLY